MLRKVTGWVIGAAFFLFSTTVSASPFNVSGDSGRHDDSVSVALLDSSTDSLQAATIEILFQPQYLKFQSVTTGDVTATFLLVPNDLEADQGKVVASLVGTSTQDGASGSLLGASFLILPNAPVGDLPVTFQCSDFGSGLGCVDYDIPETTGYVTVQASEIPEPSVGLLMLLGLSLFFGSGKAMQRFC